MGLPETLLTVLGAAVLMALVLGFVLRLALRARPVSVDDDATRAMAADLDALKASLSEVKQKLAVEELRSSRVATLEAELADTRDKLEASRDAKAGAEAELAGLRETLAAAGRHAADLDGRAQAAQAAMAETVRELSALRGAKAAVDGELSARVAEVTGLEANLLDARRRLEAAAVGHTELEGRFAQLREEKSRTDGALSAKTEAARNGDAKISELQLQVAQLTADLSGSQEAAADLRTANATIRETLDQERKAADEKLALLKPVKINRGTRSGAG